MLVLKRVLLALAGIALSLCIAEITLRFMPQYRFESMASLDSKWDNCMFYGEFRPSRLFGHELIPHANATINAFGMRDKEYPLVKPKGTFRILLLGDSLCERGRWSEYLEDMLNARGACEILNAGTSAWELNHYAIYLKNKGMRFKPDLVLVGMCLNDVDSQHTPVIFFDKKNNKTYLYNITASPNGCRDIPFTINPFLFQHSCLYRFLTVCSRRRAVEAPVLGDATTLLDMKKMAGGRICAVVFPYLKPLGHYDRFEQAAYADTLRYLQQAGIDYLDLTAYFNRYGEKIADFRVFPADKIHFNDEANKLKAKEIFPWLWQEIRKNTADRPCVTVRH